MTYNDLSGPYHYGPSAPADERDDPVPSTPIDVPQPADRFGVHIVLEVLLALGFAGALFALYRSPQADLGSADGRHLAIIIAVPILLIAMAAAVSLRVGLTNVAVGAVAAGAGVIFALNSPRGTLSAAAITIGIVLAAGLVLSILVIVLRTPGWLASGAVAIAVTAWVTARPDIGVSIDGLGLFPASSAWIWLVLTAGLSILLGIIAATSRFRDRLGDCREVAASGGPRPTATVMMMLVGLLTSVVLAGLAGIWIAWTATDLSTSEVHAASFDPLRLTLIGFAAALLGGTSAFGRIGGVLGTVLAAFGLTAALLLLRASGSTVDAIWLWLPALALGAIVNRVVEWLAPGIDDWSDDREPPRALTSSSASPDPFR
ncbi:hypothetical protein [Stackebrandtia soli]|uniref:hypothetical protein n=1 Tax=Stackebrandtia soli TaxID=1892856 RepID=UPI0039E756D2